MSDEKRAEPSLRGYSRFLKAESNQKSGKTLESLEVKLTDDSTVLREKMDSNLLRAVTRDEFLARYLENQGVMATPQNTAVLEELMPQYAVRSMLLERHNRMNANFNRFVFLDVPDISEKKREHTKPTRIAEYHSTLSLATLSSMRSKAEESAAFEQPVTGPLASVRGRVAPGLKEQKQERWRNALSMEGTDARKPESVQPQERLGRNEATLEDAFLQHMYPFSVIEEMKLPIRYYLPKGKSKDPMEKHTAVGENKKIKHSPVAQYNPSISARRYFGLVDPKADKAERDDRIGGMSYASGPSRVPEDFQILPPSLFLRSRDQSVTVYAGANPLAHSRPPLSQHEPGPSHPIPASASSSFNAPPRLESLRAPAVSTGATAETKPVGGRELGQGAGPSGSQGARGGMSGAVVEAAIAALKSQDTRTDSNLSALSTRLSKDGDDAASTAAADDKAKKKSRKVSIVLEKEGEQEKEKPKEKEGRPPESKEDLFRRRSSMMASSSTAAPLRTRPSFIRDLGKLSEEPKSAYLARRPSIAAFVVQQEAQALGDDRLPGPAQRVADLPLSALRELASDFKVKHSIVVQFMSGFVADLRDWHHTLSKHVQSKELTSEQIDIVGRELMNERVYSLMMLILQWVYLGFLFRHCEEATKEIRKQSQSSQNNRDSQTGDRGMRPSKDAEGRGEASGDEDDDFPLPAPSTRSEGLRERSNSIISSKPILGHDRSFKVPVASKLQIPLAEEQELFNAEVECEELLHKILIEFGELYSHFRHHKALGKQGTFVLLPLWLTATRALIDSILSRTYAAFTKSVMGRGILKSIQERMTETFDPHGFLAETPLLRSHPVSIRIMRTMGWKVHQPTWHHANDTSPLVRAALLRPRAPENLSGAAFAEKKRKQQQRLLMGLSRPTLPRGEASGRAATSRAATSQYAGRDAADVGSEEAYEEEMRKADGRERRASPPPSPGYTMHPTLMAKMAGHVQRIRKPEHQRDLLRVAWKSSKRTKHKKVPTDFVKARLPLERDSWIKGTA